MKLFVKMFAVALVLALLVLAAFVFWGESLETLFNQEACAEWFEQSRSYAWLIAIGLMISDLILPVPATAVMAAVGYVYGPATGTLISFTGSFLAAMLGYTLARWGGKPVLKLISDEQEICRFHKFFDRWGGGGIIISRSMPILSEVTSVMAGLARMSIARFLGALVLGTVPAAFLFTWTGHASKEIPSIGIPLAILAPLILWLVFIGIARQEANNKR